MGPSEPQNVCPWCVVKMLQLLTSAVLNHCSPPHSQLSDMTSARSGSPQRGPGPAAERAWAVQGAKEQAKPQPQMRTTSSTTLDVGCTLPVFALCLCPEQILHLDIGVRTHVTKCGMVPRPQPVFLPTADRGQTCRTKKKQRPVPVHHRSSCEGPRLRLGMF